MCKPDTIVTSFPSPTEVDHNLPDCTNLYDSIRAHVERCETVWDLHSLIVNEAIGYMFSHRNRTFRDIIETYRWVTSKKVGTTALSLLCIKSQSCSD
jgi:hypothetical protein